MSSHPWIRQHFVLCHAPSSGMLGSPSPMMQVTTSVRTPMPWKAAHYVARRLQECCYVKRKVDHRVSNRRGIAVGYRIRRQE